MTLKNRGRWGSACEAHLYAAAPNILETAAWVPGLLPWRAAARPAIGEENSTPPASKIMPRMGERGVGAEEEKRLLLLEHMRPRESSMDAIELRGRVAAFEARCGCLRGRRCGAQGDHPSAAGAQPAVDM